MMIEITGVEVGAEAIEVTGLAIEEILGAEDLYEDVEVPEVTYSFSRKAKNGAELKYLWKICQSQKRCQSAKSLGAKAEKLVGTITTISEAFRVKAE